MWKMLAECLAAFANGDGGLIVLGLDEQGQANRNDLGRGSGRGAAGSGQFVPPAGSQPLAAGGRQHDDA